MTTSSVILSEWETRGPESGAPLAGWQFRDRASHDLAERLTDLGWIEILELAQGIELRATSFVGRFSIGDMTITIQPKIQGAPFLSLLRYAYGFRQLKLLKPTAYGSSEWDLCELLVQQLIAEARDLIGRGVHRDYERRTARLSDLRGRIDFDKYVRTMGTGGAEVPCTYYPRTDDTVLNQAMLAGLEFAAQQTIDVDLRYQVNHLVKDLRSSISLRRLSASLIEDSKDAIDRRTVAYGPLLALIELLYAGHGLSLDEGGNHIRLSGFLFDMNRFFQALVSRFLHENLEGYVIHDEHKMKGFFEYEPAHNPRGYPDSVLRPDFAVMDSSRLVTIADAKYRDLWNTRLPQSMLYQLALYAIAQGNLTRESVILYPTPSRGAREQKINVREPIAGHHQARVILRQINLIDFEKLIHRSDPAGQGERNQMASRLVFGSA